MFTTEVIKIAFHNRQNSTGVNRLIAAWQNNKNKTKFYSSSYLGCYLECRVCAELVYSLWITF